MNINIDIINDNTFLYKNFYIKMGTFVTYDVAENAFAHVKFSFEHQTEVITKSNLFDIVKHIDSLYEAEPNVLTLDMFKKIDTNHYVYNNVNDDLSFVLLYAARRNKFITIYSINDKEYQSSDATIEESLENINKVVKDFYNV